MVEFGAGCAVSIGECMVELARGDDGRFGLGFGGDTYNSAVYMARLGLKVAYATALGDDPYSAGIMASAQAEGLDTRAILTVPGRTPGLYLIETNRGERTFHYWRDRAPARELFELPDTGKVIEMMRTASIIYLSGVTLSLYSPKGLDHFAEALTEARKSGTRVVMDSNFRPRGWAGDAAETRKVFQRFWALADIALPTFDDEAALWGDAEPAATIARLSALGPSEIVAKLGADGALAWAGGDPVLIPCPRAITPVDTTAAGDSFNAAYVAARRNGAKLADAVFAGHRLAGIVIEHPGAVVPRAAMAGFSVS